MKIVISDVQYPEKFHKLHNDLSFFPERIKIEKVEKIKGNLNDKKNMLCSRVIKLN